MGAVYYVVAYGSELGNKKTSLWMQDVAVSLVLYYGLIATIEIHFFGIALPSLLEQHFAKFDDPTSLRTFPFETRLPELSTFFLAHWHEDLHTTRIGKHCLGTLEAPEYDGSLNALNRIYHDTTWQPSPAVRLGIFFGGSFALLPPSFQEVLFEEIFTAAPIISCLLFQQDSEESIGGRRSVNLSIAINFVGVFVVLFVVYLIGKAFSWLLNKCLHRKVAIVEDEFDLNKWHKRRFSIKKPSTASRLAKAIELTAPAAKRVTLKKKKHLSATSPKNADIYSGFASSDAPKDTMNPMMSTSSISSEKVTRGFSTFTSEVRSTIDCRSKSSIPPSIFDAPQTPRSEV